MVGNKISFYRRLNDGTIGMVYYKIIDSKEWDSLNESEREVVQVNGAWRLVKKVNKDDQW